MTTSLRYLVFALMYVVVAAAALRPVTDADVWWHLATGRWVVEQAAVPDTDPFAQGSDERPWVAYSWLFGLMLYGLYSAFGLTGIVLARLALALAVVAALHRLIARREPNGLYAAGLLALALFPLSILLQERPWLFTILFWVLTLDVVLDLRDGRQTRLIWVLPPLYAAWSNLHIQFVHGLALLALACVAPWLDRALGWGDREGDTAAVAGSAGWRRLLVLTAACGLATLINPYHVRLHALVVDVGTQAGAFEMIRELQALSFRHLWEWAVLLVAGLAAFSLGRRARLSTFEILLLAGSAFCSFRARRDLWLTVVASVAILASGRPKGAAVPSNPRGVFLQAALIVVLVVLIVQRPLLYGDYYERSLEEAVASRFPEKAAEVIEERDYRGPLYNHFNWGGYLIWRLPELPVAIDGRAQLHGDERMGRSARTWNGEPGWDTDPDLAAARLVVARPDAALTTLLRLDRRWRLAHEDGVAAVFVRR